MTSETQYKAREARDQLALVLGFFPRVDAKASVILAVNTGMLAVMASNAPAVRNLTTTTVGLATIALIPIAASIWFLYRVAFPVLTGGQQSLIFFREIAGRTEARFIDDFIAQDHSAYLKDLLGQVWRNSEILKMKFNSLRWAFILMALAIIPWAFAVAMFSSRHGLAVPLLLR